MPRVTEITDPKGNASLEKVFAEEREMFGEVLNPTKIAAHCPPILRALKGLYASFYESRQISPALHALVNTRVAGLNGCPF